MTMSLLTPNELPPGPWWRLTNKDETHRGVKYKTGLNIDPLPFNPRGDCEKGGMYFFHHSQLIYVSRYCYNVKYIREVTFTSNSKIYKEDYKYKTNEFILGERKIFRLPEELSLAAVRECGLNLKFIVTHTHEL